MHLCHSHGLLVLFHPFCYRRDLPLFMSHELMICSSISLLCNQYQVRCADFDLVPYQSKPIHLQPHHLPSFKSIWGVGFLCSLFCSYLAWPAGNGDCTARSSQDKIPLLGFGSQNNGGKDKKQMKVNTFLFDWDEN